MVQTFRSREITLRNLIDRFGIQLVEEELFFPEWRSNLPEITELDRQLLDRVRAGFINLLNYPPLLEDVVRMAVLDPLLFIAGFYLHPFYVKSEESIEIVSEDEGCIVTGRMDTLVLKDRFWVMVIESKKASFSVEEGLAQILSYMLGNPHPERPCFGTIVTGGSFIFLKLVNSQPPQYGVSRLFGTRNSTDLYEVLRIFKHLSQKAINSP